jgi:asparagine synthase (glutamine-hydrolysing)
MTALVGVFGPGAASASAVLPQMFSEMRGRATSEPERMISTGVLIAAARHPWESDLPGWSGPLIVENERWIVAADASLYYVRDLRRQLTRPPQGTDSGELLLSALDQWGARFARHVEGDYAFIVWDRREHRAILARDFSARRNLVYAVTGETLVVATSPLAVVRHPDVSSEYDEILIATSAATLQGHGQRTAYKQVTRLAGGSTLAFREGRIAEVDRWVPQPFGTDFEDELSDAAAEELLSLIEQATTERLAKGPTAVWMSGGWDSTSVFASGMSALSRSTTRSQELRLISMTYPADDTGNEDAHIRAVAEHWGAPVSWVDTENVPLVSDSQRRARLRDDPMIHPFESLNRRMSQLTIEMGSRISLDGFGGDHLFDMSHPVVISDHLFHGRWDFLWREWRQSRLFRAFGRAMLLPMFSGGLREWIGTIRGRPLADGWVGWIPAWITARPEVRDQMTPESDLLPGESPSQYASRMLVCGSFISRAVSWNHAFGLDEGVQIRAPLFDTRLISWAAARPLSDRAAWGEGKRMLRRAMKGLIPDSVLARRARKTGTPAGYFKRQFQAALPARFNELFGAGGSQLGAMGIIDERALKAAVEEYLQTGEHMLGAGLLMTVEAEHWLVARRMDR